MLSPSLCELRDKSKSMTQYKETLQVQQPYNNNSRQCNNWTHFRACEITYLFPMLGITGKDTILGYTHHCYVFHYVINLKAWLSKQWDITNLTLVHNFTLYSHFVTSNAPTTFSPALLQIKCLPSSCEGHYFVTISQDHDQHFLMVDH